MNRLELGLHGKVIQRNGGALKVHTARKTWEEARRVCQSEGADLVIDNSPKIHEYLTARDERLWIGVSKAVS